MIHNMSLHHHSIFLNPFQSSVQCDTALKWVSIINIIPLTVLLQSFLLVDIVSSVLMSSRNLSRFRYPSWLYQAMFFVGHPAGFFAGFTNVCNAKRANICGASKHMRYLSQDYLLLKMAILLGIVLVRYYRSSLDIVRGQQMRMTLLRSYPRNESYFLTFSLLPMISSCRGR